jgi:hypothetical protein
MKVPKMSVIDAHELFRATGGSPCSIFNDARRKYERFVNYTDKRIGPFLTLKDYKRAAIDAYVHQFRVVPTFPFQRSPSSSQPLDQ